MGGRSAGRWWALLLCGLAAAACERRSAPPPPPSPRPLTIAQAEASAKALPGATTPLSVTHSQNTQTVPPYDVFEVTFEHQNDYPDPFGEVTLSAVFRSPTGKEIPVGGFHYGSLTPPRVEEINPHPPPKPDEEAIGREFRYHPADQNHWKLRFSPTEPGDWTYSFTFINRRGGRASGGGVFKCIASRAVSHGFIRLNEANPYRWRLDDGTPFFPVGTQDGFADSDGLGSGLSSWVMEGPYRLDRKGFPTPPPGPLFMPACAHNPMNADVYFRNYSRAGFNLFRFSQANASVVLYRDLDHYQAQEAIMVDELLAQVRKYHLHVFYGIFGSQQPYQKGPIDPVLMEKVQRFVKYSVDRWGALVDIWELLNEADGVPDEWYQAVSSYIRSIDPYHHPITTSWERPQLSGIEINSPHWYKNEDELKSDTETASRAQTWKAAGKPVIVGEQGNTLKRWGVPEHWSRRLVPASVAGPWDPRSALRMRIRLWTAMFNEISLIFWNTTYAKDGYVQNIWLGPYERQFVHAVQDFAGSLDGNVRMVPVVVSAPGTVRAYGLASTERAGVYLHHFSTHDMPAQGIRVELDVPKAMVAYWYAPDTGAILRSEAASAGRRTFTAPDFAVDMALLLTSAGPPDSDHDGIPDDVDVDRDNDGVPDVLDAFPLDPEEWQDRDHDMIGDNQDADDDGDGVGDDENHNGIPDCEELDLDGDGVPRTGSLSWDAFPFDPQEWRDTDGDGIGDNADTDKDGDGFSDEEERRAGTDPMDRLNFPIADRRGSTAARATGRGALDAALVVFAVAGVLRRYPRRPRA